MARHLPGGSKRVTLGADEGYDTQEFDERLRALDVTPHVAQNTSRSRSRIDEAHAPRRLLAEPEEAQTCRAGLQLEEDRCRLDQTDLARSLITSRTDLISA